VQLYFVRHGEDYGPLTETGIRQAREAAEVIAGTIEVDGGAVVLLTSPEQRAYETAAIIGSRLGIEPKREMWLGCWVWGGKKVHGSRG